MSPLRGAMGCYGGEASPLRDRDPLLAETRHAASLPLFLSRTEVIGRIDVEKHPFRESRTR